MLRKLFDRFFSLVNLILYRPKKVFYVFAGLVFISLVFDGTLIQLWRLQSEYKQGAKEIRGLSQRIQQLDAELLRAQKLDYIEKEARTRFDLVEEGDLVFVFTESELPN
ncbi:MAG: septum formation initiator family protein [Bdellovibrionales bacterium]